MEIQIEQVLIGTEELKARVNLLGRRITADYRGKDLVLVGILKGSVFFITAGSTSHRLARHRDEPHGDHLLLP